MTTETLILKQLRDELDAAIKRADNLWAAIATLREVAGEADRKTHALNARLIATLEQEQQQR